jgi:hypothetical protein
LSKWCGDSSVGASELNNLLNASANWDDDNDRWNHDTSGSGNVSVNGTDIDLRIPFQDLQYYYSLNTLNGSGDYTAVNDDYLKNYFINFVNDIKNNVLVNGGEVMFTDETLVGTEFTPEDLAATIRYAASLSDLSGSGMDVLGDSADVTSGSGDTGTLVGSTNVQHDTTVDSLQVLSINKMLRKMMDIGYNNREASGSGIITGSGVDGLIDQNPFKAGDVFFFGSGFGIDAKVHIDNELHEEHNQLLNGSGTAPTDITASTNGITYTKDKHYSNLFIVLA